MSLSGRKQKCGAFSFVFLTAYAKRLRTMDKAVVWETAEDFGVRQRLFFGTAIRAWVTA